MLELLKTRRHSDRRHNDRRHKERRHATECDTHFRRASPVPSRRVTWPSTSNPVTAIQVTEAEDRGLRTAKRVLRLGVMIGSMAAAWEIGMVVGRW